MAKLRSAALGILVLVALGGCPADPEGPQIAVQDTTIPGSPLNITQGSVDDLQNEAVAISVPVVWTFTITNRGDELLELTGGGGAITSSNDVFVVGTPSSTVIEPGQSATVSIDYSAGYCAGMVESTTITIQTNDPSAGTFSFTLNVNAFDTNQC